MNAPASAQAPVLAGPRVPDRHIFVTQDYPPAPGGMARRHADLCRRFAPRPVTVSTVAAPGAATFDAGERTAIERLPFGFDDAHLLTNQWRWYRRLVAHRRHYAGSTTVLHCGNIRPCGHAVWWLHRHHRVPYLLYVNGSDLVREEIKARGRLRRAVTRRILGDAAGIVAISAWTARLAAGLLARLGIERPPEIATIDLGTDPEVFRPERDTGQLRHRLGLGDAPLLLTAARLVPHKGIDTALRVLAHLRRNHPRLRYLVAGSGRDAPRLRSLALELGLDDAVIFAGTLSEADLAEAHATATLYLGLSRVHATVNVEGFGLVFVEAAASGTPCVAGDSGGIRSAVRDGETGLIVAPEDIGAATQACDRLLSDTALRAGMAAAGRRAVETHYNLDRVADETLAFVDRVTSKVKASR